MSTVNKQYTIYKIYKEDKYATAFNSFSYQRNSTSQIDLKEETVTPQNSEIFTNTKTLQTKIKSLYTLPDTECNYYLTTK